MAPEDQLKQGFAIVVDIGKTMSKVSLWSRAGEMLDRRVRSNALVETNGIRRLDASGIGDWLIETLGAYTKHPVEYVIPVGHGAGVAALVDDALAFAPLDYEQAIPDDLLQAYRVERDPFATTGSPALPVGLNLGSQIYWLDRLYPEAMARATLVPWAQYWAWFLSGHAVSEVTSLGCHSDLWSSDQRRFSPLAERMGWAEQFAPLAKAGDEVGTLRPAIATATGLSPQIRVLAGIHDSNAALLAARGFGELVRKEMTTLSTGTWFVAMRTADEVVRTDSLPEGSDCLVNIDAYGRPIPSSRFMGGREIETVIELDTRQVDIKPDQPALLAAVSQVLASRAMLLPTLAPGCGPYPHGTGRWLRRPENWYERRAAACLYAALVADAALDLIGSKERLLIEGRFAEAEVFVRALASLRPDTAVYVANAHNDVSFGALRLLDSSLAPRGDLVIVQPLDADLETYRSAWHAELGAMV
jgi:sugar (pentulose or hexulose) kinase